MTVVGVYNKPRLYTPGDQSDTQHKLSEMPVTDTVEFLDTSNCDTVEYCIVSLVVLLVF